MQISQQQARLILLHQQGLLFNIPSTIRVIEKIGYIQIDTISVTERSHNHVLHTRNENFRTEELTNLMTNKEIFEYWSHAAAYLPMKDFRFSLYRKEQYKSGNKHWFPRDKKVDNYVLDRIKAEGPLQSKDFENPRNKDHKWYDWKPAKIALTNLFMDGTIMIKERRGFQKVFDLTENVLPTGVNTSTPSLKEYCIYLINNTINYFGLATIEEMCYLRKGVKSVVKTCIKELLEENKITLVNIESNSNNYYSFPSIMNGLSILKNTNHIHILNPFDNLIIQRKKPKEIFNFNYQIECYVPEKKRVFGYYTLPILYGTEFIGRFDAKADRKTKIFTIKNLWLEESFSPKEEFYNGFKVKLNSFMLFCGCEKIEILKTTPTKLKKELKSFL